MVPIEYILQIYKIAKQWFDYPIIVVIVCLIGHTTILKKKNMVLGFAVRTGDYLHYIAVKKRLTGKGHGTQLFKKIYPHINYLNVKIKLRRAIAFYKKFGFKIKNKEQWITGKRYLMVKNS